MLKYVVRRLLQLIPTMFAISVVVFFVIQLPPGDYVTALAARRQELIGQMTADELAALRAFYGLDQPVYVQYFDWLRKIIFEGQFGTSFEYQRPVRALIGERIGMTAVIAVSTLLFTWILAFPIGIYAAVKQYSIGDYIATTFGFLGLATPNFLIALMLMYFGLVWFDYVPAGLCSPEWCNSAWNLGRIIDLLKHMWPALIVIGTAGTAGLIRILRANLLDELRRPYVVAARARGLHERTLLRKYPLRVALNPFVSTAGWAIYVALAGDLIVGTLLGLPTLGPLLLQALQVQDMYLAGGILVVLSVMLVTGTLISDLLLGWLDPRIRLGYR